MNQVEGKEVGREGGGHSQMVTPTEAISEDILTIIHVSPEQYRVLLKKIGKESTLQSGDCVKRHSPSRTIKYQAELHGTGQNVKKWMHRSGAYGSEGLKRSVPF